LADEVHAITGLTGHDLLTGRGGVMARGRMLNRSISHSKKVADLVNELGSDHGLFLTWMIAHLDREGRIHGDPEVLKGMVAPRIAAITPAVIRQTAARAMELGLIQWYEVDGDSFIAFPGFPENQVGLRVDREPKSQIPPPSSEPSHHIDASLPPNCRQTADNHPSEGKGREGKGIEGKGKRDALKLEADPAQLALVKQEPPAFSLPLIDGSEQGFSVSEIEAWIASFPAVDVPQQLRQMRAWCDANPKMRKTRTGIKRFVVTWLSKAQDSTRVQPPATRGFNRQDEALRESLRGANEMRGAFDGVFTKT
jgi:hypothetical protein